MGKSEIEGRFWITKRYGLHDRTVILEIETPTNKLPPEFYDELMVLVSKYTEPDENDSKPPQ